jgi:hypothetical protein
MAKLLPTTPLATPVAHARAYQQLRARTGRFALVAASASRAIFVLVAEDACTSTAALMVR